MPKQYAFTIWRAGKKPCTYYNVCHDEESAMAWMVGQGKYWGFGELGLDWEIQSVTSRSLSQVYAHDSDKVSYLCDIVEELFAREVTANCPNTELRGLSWTDLCDVAIEMLEELKK